MDSLSAAFGLKDDELIFLAATALVAGSAALLVCFAFYCWFRREQRNLQRKIVKAIVDTSREPGALFLTGRTAASYGELVAQFKVNQGKQVVSVLESEGKRFIHVVGDLSPEERSKMVRYLKSEGFMS
jgi:hypothetical protein